MTMLERMSLDIKAAMKAGDKLRLETLRTLRAALMEKEIELRGSGRQMTSDAETATLMSAAKKRKESIEQFTKGGRMDLADQESRELAIIREYLPSQMSPDEVERIVAEIVTRTGASGAKDFGRVMPEAMKQLKGKAEGKLVQELVRKALGV